MKTTKMNERGQQGHVLLRSGCSGGDEEEVEDMQYGTGEDSSLCPDYQGDYWGAEDVRRVRVRRWGVQGRKEAR